MKEEEIRERIERFLKKTARNVVVPGNVVEPASVGLSLSGAIRVTREVGLDVAINTTVYRENSRSIVRTVRPGKAGPIGVNHAMSS